MHAEAGKGKGLLSEDAGSCLIVQLYAHAFAYNCIFCRHLLKQLGVAVSSSSRNGLDCSCSYRPLHLVGFRTCIRNQVWPLHLNHNHIDMLVLCSELGFHECAA